MTSLAVQFGALNTVADPQTARGKTAIQSFQGHLDMLKNQLGKPGGEIPPDVKRTIVSRIDEAKAGMVAALADNTITPEERSGLVSRATKIGITADKIVAAQTASPNAPVPADTYRAIVK